MPTINNKRKYIFPIIGVGILGMLIAAVFYSLMFGKDVFQGSVGSIGGGKSAAVQFDFQHMKGLSGITAQ